MRILTPFVVVTTGVTASIDPLAAKLRQAAAMLRRSARYDEDEEREDPSVVHVEPTHAEIISQEARTKGQQDATARLTAKHESLLAKKPVISLQSVLYEAVNRLSNLRSRSPGDEQDESSESGEGGWD
jgi:hypothetical protein